MWKALTVPSLLHRCFAAFAFGLLAALAFPPFNAIPVLWLSFPGLVVLLGGGKERRFHPGFRRDDEKRKTARAFLIGWCFAFGFLLVSLYWIAGALFVEIGTFWWVLPFAVAGLPALFALYYGIAASAAARWGLDNVSGVFFFALCWWLADIARAHLFTGFPWDMVGYAWGDILSVLQITSVVGIEGLTLLTLLLAVLPAAFFMMEKKKAALWFLSGVLLFSGIGLWGAQRIQNAPEAFVPDVRLRLVQPNIDQKQKWQEDQRYLNLEKLLELSFAAPGEKPLTHIIWPETATAFYLTERPDIRLKIAALMPKESVLLTGVVRRQQDEGGALRYYNSLVVMDSMGRIIGGYDKHHLVPFGEFMPLRSILPFRVITAMGKDFTSGDGVRSLRAPGLPSFGPLVCYEAIFSGEVASKEDPPQFLLNVTNDAWYKGTIGPAQHFSIVRVRAIEEGRPLVRVANGGVSATVDPYGKIVASTGEANAAFIDSPLPKPLPDGTIKGKQGDRASWLMAMFLFVSLLLFRVKRESIK